MKNVVSFETAKALRDAGFSIPEPNHGQFWYLEYTGELEVITFVGGNGVHRMYIPFLKGMNSCAKDAFLNGSVFAPTATDIMKELGRHFSMSIDYIGWIVRHHDLSEHGVGRHVHENPAEACALAWLELKKK